MQVTLDIDTRQFRRDIARATDREVPRVMAKAINRTMFEALDAEKDHVAAIFSFAGAGTKRFMSGRGSFRFNAAKATSLEAVLFPARKNAELLDEHQRGGSVTLRDGPRLAVRGDIAVPIRAKRGTRGRVPKRQLPSEVLKPGGGGFVSGGIVFKRQGRGGRDLVPLFSLQPQVRLDARFEFFRTFESAVRRNFATKARQEFGKARFNR